MGQLMSSSPEDNILPDFKKEPTFDPLYGFPNGRKPRVMRATQLEMEASKMPFRARDYCAHLQLDYYRCRNDVWPLAYKCHDERHTLEHCQHEDYILRMKEYEREKRLLRRQKRKERLHNVTSDQIFNDM